MAAHPAGRMSIIQFVELRAKLMKLVDAREIHPQRAYDELALRALSAIEVAAPRLTKKDLKHIAYLTMTFRQWAKLQVAEITDEEWARITAMHEARVALMATPPGVEDQS